MSKEQDMLSLYMPMPPTPTTAAGTSTPCTCCIKCSQERIYRTVASPSSSGEFFKKMSLNQPTPTKTKIFKPTVLMDKHISMNDIPPKKRRTFEYYTGEQYLRKSTLITNKIPRVQYPEGIMTKISSEKPVLNQSSFHKRDLFQRQGRFVKSVEYYEESSKETIEKVPLTIASTASRTSSLMIPPYEQRTFSSSSSPLVLYESHSPSSSSYSSLIPTPPPPLLHTPSLTPPAALRIPSLVEPNNRRLNDFKAGSFDSNNSIDSSFSGSDEEVQVVNKTKTHRAVVERAKYERTIKLYKFLIDLLEDRHPCVMWINRETGIFKITDSEQLANLWGEVKMNASMTYEKLARSFRHYYKKGILDSGETVISPVSKCGKRKLYYKFSVVTLKRFLGIGT